MKTNQISNKSIARIAAVQTIYQIANDRTIDLASLLLRTKEFYKDADFKIDNEVDPASSLKIKPSFTYLEELTKFTVDNLEEIDETIAKFLTKEWTINNLPLLLHSILRVAFCEIIYFPETPKKVVINEYTDIASDMLAETEVGFVNSVLHNYANIIRSEK